MADGDVHRPPHYEAIGLGQWAVANDAYLDGLLTLNGGPDPRSLSARRLVNLVYAVLVQEGNAFTDMSKVREDLDKRLRDLKPEEQRLAEWGEGAEAQEGMQAAMRLAGSLV